MLVSFVGAGLSLFAYYSWSELLTKLTKRDDVCKIKSFVSKETSYEKSIGKIAKN